jgi:hypothetical protein
MGFPPNVIQNLLLSRGDDTQWRTFIHAINEWRKFGGESPMQNNINMIVDDTVDLFMHHAND